MTSLKQKTDQWVKDIKEALIIFKGLNRSETETMAAFDKVIKDLYWCGQVTDKNGELSVEVVKAIDLANRQAAYCRNRAANPSDPEYAAGYRRGEQVCRQRAASIQSLLKDILEKNVRFKGLMAELKKHKVFYYDMIVIGEIGLAEEHLKKVSHSMDAVIQELETLGKMKLQLQQAQRPVALQR